MLKWISMVYKNKVTWRANTSVSCCSIWIPLLTSTGSCLLLLTVNTQSDVQSSAVWYLKAKWWHIPLSSNPAQTVEIVKDWGEPHQSCCPSNGQLGLTQSEVNYSHISVSVCVSVWDGWSGRSWVPLCAEYPSHQSFFLASQEREWYRNKEESPEWCF